MKRDFLFTNADFDRIRQLVKQHAGISLSEAKKDVIYSRLSRRLRALGLTRFSDYCKLVESGRHEELINFTNSVTTNLTSFFREKHHFDYLESTVLPSIFNSKPTNPRLRIWSAGCSTGEEPYSLAITARESLPTNVKWDIRILATDLDSNVLTHATNGIYAADRVRNIPELRLRRWFLRGKGAQIDQVTVSEELKRLIVFRQLNLLGQWPFRGPFDIIFCRNVVIYFDKDTQKQLFDRYADILVDGGHLFIGHSESLFKVTERFELIGHSIYRKIS